MTLPQLTPFTDVALLFLRRMVGVVFFATGSSDLKNPAAQQEHRNEQGLRDFSGRGGSRRRAGDRAGMLRQLAALGLILVLCGSISKKIFAWHSGFWGKSGTNGWCYDPMMVVMNFVIVTTGGGSLRLARLIQ
jgi:uncharacterized membrane protein YphA (DoxX/SURF4 family)